MTTTRETIVVLKFLEGLINRSVTDKMTTAYKDTGKGAGMEAIKTILDIQASLLTLVFPIGVLRGVQSAGPWLTERTPPVTLQVAEKGTRVGLLLAVEK